MSAPETTHEVVVVGSGFAGLGQLLALRRAGITDVVLLEKADAPGGTWPNPDPSRSYSSQPELRDHLERLADDHDLRRHVRVGVEVTGATWDEQDRTWWVHTRGGTTWRARFLVLGTGALHLPVPTDDEQRPRRSSVRRRIERLVARYVERSIGDPDLAATLTPDDAIGGTRGPGSDDDSPTLARPDVEVITGGVREVRSGTIVDGDGTERGVDVVVHGPGFPVTAALDRLEITGRGGRTLRQTWAEHGTATHLGMTVSDFPNLFLLLDPDTGLGHDSAVLVIECQTRYVAQAITTVHATGMGGLDVRAEVQQRSNAAVQRRRARGTGTGGGCTSRDHDAAGVDRTIWPGSTVGYWWRTRRFEPADFELFGRAADAAATPTPEEAAERTEGAEDRSPEAVPTRR